MTGVARSGRQEGHVTVIDESHLLDQLAQTDVLIMILPSTSATHGVLDAKTLAALPAHAWVVNVGRGDAVDEPALRDARRGGRIGGAALDVTSTEPLPPERIGKLAEARRFGEGFATTEYLAATLLDQAWHRLAPDAVVDDVERFEAAALAAARIDVPSAPPRYRSTYFNHVFGGSYSAGYYSYIWSEVLDADTVEWFGEHGGLRR